MKGYIDIYPEYTGTITEEILARKGIRDNDAIRKSLAEKGIRMSALGFNNNYAIGMKKVMAEKLHISRISTLRDHPELIFGFSNEFMERADGWQGLRSRYGLPQKKVSGMDHDLAYRGLESGSIHATDLYTTDAEIDYYGLQTLEDDLHYFPVYTAVLLYRADLEERAPHVVAAIKELEGRISDADMRKMNELVKIEKKDEASVAAEFLNERFSLKSEVRRETVAEQVWTRTEGAPLSGFDFIARSNPDCNTAGHYR